MKKLVLLSTCLFIAGSASFANNLAKNIKSLKTEIETNPRLGYGYDRRTGLAMATNCLSNYNDSNAIEYSNPTGTINFTTAMSETELDSYLNVSGSGDFGIEFFSASASAKYAKSNRNTRSSLSFNYYQTFTLDANYKLPGVGNDKALSPEAKDLLSKGNDVFTATCGNTYVNHAKMGALLLVSARIEFASSAQKDTFEASAGTKIAGLISVEGSFSKEENASTKDARLIISAIQLGGDPTKLANIFGAPGPDGYYILTCASGATGDCSKAINKIIEYAQNDFQKSIDLTNPETKKNYYTYGINTMTYKQIGVFATLPDLTDEAIKAKEYLMKQVEQDIEIYNYLLRYSNQPFVKSFSKRPLDNLHQSIRDYEKINRMYYNNDIIYACYGSGAEVSKNCIKVAEVVKNLHNNYKESIEIAHKFASTYLAEGAISLTFIGAGDCNRQGYTVFSGAGNYGIPNLNRMCYMDLTPNNEYARQWANNLIGYFYICDEVNGVSQYGKRVTINLPWKDHPEEFIIMGYKQDGIEHDYQLNQQGYNGDFSFSYESDFRYNPI